MTTVASRRLWDIAAPGADLSCRLSPVCGGVELVIERGGLSLVREIHPDHSTAYERARALRASYDESICSEQQLPWLPTRTCALRPWRTSDVPALAHHANDSSIGLNLRDGFPYPYTRAHAEAFIAHALSLAPPSRFAIVVEGEAVGSIGFSLNTNVERVSAEMGYWLGTAYRGRGIMTDAVRALTRYAVATHRLTRIYAVPYEWNPASFRVLEKAGYACEGRMRRSAVKDGRVIDQLLYAYVVAEPGNPDARIEDPRASAP